jgi:transglutaminase-like putative cysteine protease
VETADDGREFTFTYAFTVYGVPEGAANVRAWIPIAQTTRYQNVKGMTISGLSPEKRDVVKDPVYENAFLRCDLTDAVRAASGPLTITATYRVLRLPCRALDTEGDGTMPAPPARFLTADRLVPIDGKIEAEAKRVAGASEGDLDRARKLYDHVVTSMAYDKSGEGWGRGDALYACDVRAGNCSDFHSLFIGEARALKIPARFIMGFPLPADRKEGTIGGYHCWAEFFVPDYGWIPVDASEASKNPARQAELFGGLDANRIRFTVGRDIPLPGAKADPRNFIVAPHVEVDGVVYENVELQVSFADR